MSYKKFLNLDNFFNFKNSLKIFFIFFILINTVSKINAHEERFYIEQNPVEMLQKITDNVIKTLNDREEFINVDSSTNMNKKVYNVINKYIIPNIDLKEMSRWIMGKIVWQKSTKEERNKFIHAFKYLLIGNYYITLNNYKTHDLKFLPIKEKDFIKKKLITVHSTINNRINNKVLYIDYKLMKRNGKWKVYDIVVEGVSLLKSYQSQFKDQIRKNGLKKTTEEILLSNKIKYVK